MYLLEYVFIMLVIRLIKILIDVDYCNIFFKVDSKRARWIVCIIVYVAAAFISIIEAFIVIYVIMQVYSGTLDKKILFASMNVALECIADMGTSYILPGSSSIQDVAGNYDIELGYYLPRQFITIMLFYFLVIVVTERENTAICHITGCFLCFLPLSV